jgi:peptidoglycan DL-endopeptidase LytE
LKRFMKTVIWSFAVGGFAAALSFSAPSEAQASAAADYGVKLQVNDSLVWFPESSPFLNASGTLLVPIRAVAEKMGYHVDGVVEGSNVSLKLSDSKNTVTFKTGSTEAVVNGKPIKMDTAPLFSGGTTFVPLRFLSESFGYIVQWDDANAVAIIGQDGNYHSPAWYAPPKKTQSDLLLETAQTYIGVRYMWGGTTPGGFDCSGFVNYVYDQYGIDLPRTSRSMYDSVGTSTVGLAPGDLVFFNIGKVTTHVGIYLGDERFVSATTSRGVQIDSLSSGYWGSRFIGAKRVM